MILTHGANSLVRGKYVEIGGRRYPVVKIGNQEWLAENLDYLFDGCSYGGSATDSPKAWYYNNDETTYGYNGRKCNLLYNWYAAKYLDDNKATLLPSGWRVPTNADWHTLVSSVGTDAGTKLKAANLGWATSWGGTDDYGLSILPAGCYNGGMNRFEDSPEAGMFFLPSDSSSNGERALFLYNQSNVLLDTYDNKRNGFSIRLVKDVS